MGIKEEITNRFDKNNFKLQNAGREVPVPDDSWEGIDEYIREFLIKLNLNENITTHFSCEGHSEGDHAYVYFNVNSQGWDIFWLEIMPELSAAFCLNTSKGNLHIAWSHSITNNEYGAGISIYCHLTSSEFISWQEKKKLFWDTMEQMFLKYYPSETILV